MFWSNFIYGGLLGNIFEYVCRFWFCMRIIWGIFCMKIFCWKLESFGIFVFLFEIMLLVFDILFIFIVVDDNKGDGYFIVRGEFCCCFFYFFIFINDVVNVC